jgi:hypothetical protein
VNPVLVARYVTPARPAAAAGPGGPFSAVRVPATRMVIVGSVPGAAFAAVDAVAADAVADPARPPPTSAAPAASAAAAVRQRRMTEIIVSSP